MYDESATHQTGRHSSTRHSRGTRTSRRDTGGCEVPRALPKTFREAKGVVIAAIPDSTAAENVNYQNPDQTLQKLSGKLQPCGGCKYMAKDTVIEALEDEKRKEQLALEKEREKRQREEEERRKVISRAKVKGRYKNALMATRMNRFLQHTTASRNAKLAEETAAHNAKSVLNADGTSRLPRPFEDPLLRLQRKMANENKDHFILLHQRLVDFWYYKVLCNAVFKTCDEAFQVHSCLIAAHCGFWGDFCDERPGEVGRDLPVEIDLRKRITGVGMKTVLHYLYTGRIKVGHENCVEVFDCARALKMRVLSHLTERFIKVLLQDHNLWSTVSATRNTNSAVFDIAWTKLATRFVRLSKLEPFCRVELLDLMWFLESDELLVTSELQVFQAAMTWICYDRRRRMSDFSTVMGAVRFAYMTTDELVQCMNSDPIFKEEAGIQLLSSANLAKVFANENQQWSGYDLHQARRPEFSKKLKKFLNPEPRALLEEELRIKQLDAQVSTNSLDLGKLFDKKYIGHVPI